MTERIIDRIRKMLAIANDLAATEEERDTALNMAYKTMAKYNLEIGDIKEKETGEPREAHEYQGFSFPFAREVCNSVADLFFCFYLSSYKVNGTQQIHRFIGRASNVATAMVMADYIIKSIMKEGRKLYKQNTSPECRSFCIGAARKLATRVAAMRAAAEAENRGTGTCIVLADYYKSELEANDKLAMDLFKYKIGREYNPKITGDAYRKGSAYGDMIDLNLQVDQAATSKPLSIKGN